MERGLRIRSVSLAPWTFHHTDDSPAKRARELEQVYLSQAPSEMARRDRAVHPRCSKASRRNVASSAGGLSSL
jgi:hypothetical protein